MAAARGLKVKPIQLVRGRVGPVWRIYSVFWGWDFSWDDGDEAEWFIQVGEYPILVWQIGPGDIYADGRNNLRDWAVFAEWWMRDDCGMLNYYCEWADMDFSGDVGVGDLALLANCWLEVGIYD